jgi:NADH dehydrogenase [ubiquinone] 1 alpha subcomplex assembly factor 7
VSLADELRRMIEIDGPISIAQYMTLCLTHPRYGYYVTRDPFGTDGDFTTAPEISQMFGELIGLWAAQIWLDMGAEGPITLVELGPGRGTLMADALRAITQALKQESPPRVHLVEVSPTLRAAQRAALSASGAEISWHDDLRDLPSEPMIFIANEFFDALPVDHYARAGDGWHQRVVGLNENGDLAFAFNPVPALDFEKAFAGLADDAPLGAIIENRSAAYALELIWHLKNSGGAALIIDYGYIQSRLGETLQAVRAHQYVDPLADPGEADLTAHVDFGALAHAGRASGMRVGGPRTQSEFLRALGIEHRAARLKKNAMPEQAVEIDAALTRLVELDQMGELFKVVALAHPDIEVLPGFD